MGLTDHPHLKRRGFFATQEIQDSRKSRRNRNPERKPKIHVLLKTDPVEQTKILSGYSL